MLQVLLINPWLFCCLLFRIWLDGPIVHRFSCFICKGVACDYGFSIFLKCETLQTSHVYGHDQKFAKAGSSVGKNERDESSHGKRGETSHKKYGFS
jgi:hypothetical protein